MPIALAAFLAACVLLFSRRVLPQTVFAEFDWSLLVFFSALFIITGSLDANGVTRQLFDVAAFTRHANVWNLSAVTAVLSNLVSNVPAVLLLKSVVAGLSNPQAGWLTVANLIVAEIAFRYHIELSFWEYTRAGAIITIYSLAVGIVWIQITAWR